MKGLLKTVKSLLKTTKGKVIAGAASTGVVGAAVVIGIALHNPSYRTIIVEEVNGTGIVSSEKKDDIDAYAGMHLYSGDDVTVQDASDMTLLLDMDKYVYAEENTHFWLEAEGNSEKSRTRIHLDKGAELNRIDTKLTDGEEYQVQTPNSVMSVRGTVYRVNVYYDDKGQAWTSVEVFQGSVEITLQTLEGELNGVSEVFEAGESALIRAASDFSEFVVDEDGDIKREIEYKNLPRKTALKLVEYMEDGEELCIGKELFMDYTKLEEHKLEEVIAEEPTCMKEGKKEIRCVICGEVEETVSIPKLEHETTGEWVTVREPGCTVAGKEQKVCMVCNGVIETRDIAALGHTPGDFEVTQEPTCTAEGSRSRTCLRCGLVETESIAKLAHESSDWKITSRNSCTADGEKVKTCLHCGTILEKETIPATGHQYGAWSQTKQPTCTDVGENSRVCANCGATEKQTIAALGHTPGEAVEHEFPDSFDSNGKALVNAFYQCITCGVDVVEQHTISMVKDEYDKMQIYCETCKTYLLE